MIKQVAEEYAWCVTTLHAAIQDGKTEANDALKFVVKGFHNDIMGSLVNPFLTFLIEDNKLGAAKVCVCVPACVGARTSVCGARVPHACAMRVWCDVQIAVTAISEAVGVDSAIFHDDDRLQGPMVSYASNVQQLVVFPPNVSNPKGSLQAPVWTMVDLVHPAILSSLVSLTEGLSKDKNWRHRTVRHCVSLSQVERRLR